MHNIPRLLRFLILAAGIHLIIFFILRFSLYWYFNSPTDPITADELLHAFYLGTKFDLRLSLMMLLPLFVFGGMRFISPFEYDYARRFWLGIQALIFALTVLFYFINFAHYSYLHKPLDASAIRFLQNFGTSMEMVWSSYPIVWLSLLLLSLTAGYVYLLNKIIMYFSNVLVPMLSRKRKILIGTLSTFIVIFGLYGKVSYYPLRWSDAFFSTHSFTPTVAMNPILYFLNTLKNRDVSFDENKAKKAYPAIAAYLGVDKTNRNNLNFDREVKPNKRFKKPPNIVVVILESFSSYKTGLSGNPLNPTPHIDKLAKNGIYFDRFYTPSTGTARSVWTLVTGIPDVETNKTSTRNPLIVDQHTIINSFKDYEKLYFIGGSASWGNIRGLLSSNIPGLQLYEEGKYTSPRMDVWGISDLHLFEEANAVLKTQEKPFFAIVQTSGNHRPYNIPEDHKGYVTNEISRKEAKNYGFLNSKEYNSFRFMDHSVGFFMQEAKKQKYFDNTIFVFFGDHGVVGKANHMTPAQNQLHINPLNVPLILYAPKLLKPKQYSFAASEVDVMPTLASLAGFPYTNTTLGTDLLDPNINKNRYIFTMEHRKPLLIGVTGKEKTTAANFDGSQFGLYDLNSKTPRNDISKKHFGKSERLKRLTFALYETIKYMRYHNKPR